MASLPSGEPPMGGSGQIDVPGPIIESAEPLDAPPEDGDDRVAVIVGAQEHGPNSPTHGAAGGIEVDFASVAPITLHEASTSTGMTTSHPAFGRSSK